MKTVYICVLISLLSISETSAGHSTIEDRQYWYNGYLNRTIEIFQYEDGIEVKGLHSNLGYFWFQRRSSHSYFDRYGNKIKLYRTKIIYYSNRRNSRLTFLPVYDRFDRRNCEDEYRDRGYHDHDYYDRERYDDYRRNNNRHGADNTYRKDRKSRPSEANRSYEKRGITKNENIVTQDKVSNDEIEGTWKVKDLSKKVYIVDTRDGIKARFSDELKWYVYKSKGQENEFIAENGQTYTLKNGVLIWSNGDLTKTFYMTKISDELEE
jgi:hypothetical protein